MAFSYCWAYQCLPDPFSRNNFTATAYNVARFNIAGMPSGIYNTTVAKQEGTGLTVIGNMKNQTGPLLQFNQSGLVTMPSGGVYDLTFSFAVPIGFDDLSTGIIMDLKAGPPSPPSPPAPPGSVCPCPGLPYANNGSCPVGRTPLIASLLNTTGVAASQTTYTQCVNYPNYDVLSAKFAFSLCWRWACLPASFAGKAYLLQTPKMSQYNVPYIPSGDLTLSFLSDARVNISMTAFPAVNLSNYRLFSESGVVTVPSGGFGSVQITYVIPSDPEVDGQSGAVVGYATGNMLRPPRPPSPPPSPPPAPSNATSPNSGSYNVTIMSSFLLIRNITSQAALDALLANYSNALAGNIAGFTANLPVSFPDYGVVQDCNPNTIRTFLNNLAASLGLDPAALACSSCTLNPSGLGYSRRLQHQHLHHHRALFDDASVGTSCNTASSIILQVSHTVNATTDVENSTGSLKDGVATNYPTSCVGSATIATNVNATLSQLISYDVAANESQALNASISVCSGLSDTILTSGEASTCQENATIVNENNSSANKKELNKAALIGGLAGGLGGAVVLVGAFVVGKKIHQRRKDRPKSNRARGATNAATHQDPGANTGSVAGGYYTSAPDSDDEGRRGELMNRGTHQRIMGAGTSIQDNPIYTGQRT